MDLAIAVGHSEADFLLRVPILPSSAITLRVKGIMVDWPFEKLRTLCHRISKRLDTVVDKQLPANSFRVNRVIYPENYTSDSADVICLGSRPHRALKRSRYDVGNMRETFDCAEGTCYMSMMRYGVVSV